ncbi:B3/B4 domain-containing protein [Zooshikella sp. RANM57]|uniref:B3/B4 domain-containing protein n=1 Tax=Zooshikella sp. RANM57 TaxID=3425863 RepID=UPI003D702242
MIKLNVDPAIWSYWSTLQLGVVKVTGVDNEGAATATAEHLRSVQEVTARQVQGVTISELPEVAAWREAYRLFGAKPKRYPCSLENLLQRLKREQFPRAINPLVDIYNIVSLQYRVPVGGEDIAKIQGDLWLRFATENEPSIQLLGEPEARAPKPGEVIYSDNVGAVCRRWNWKEAERTKLTATTKDAILVVESLQEASLQPCLEALVELVSEYCGGVVESSLFTKPTQAES